jgi:hypothetical protein
MHEKGGEKNMEEKKSYETPMLLEYGSIADRTFQTPGGVKGCQENCHLDTFGENSGLS